MICLHKGFVLFDLIFYNIISMSLNIEDLVINNEVILPLNINYLNVVSNKEIKTFHDSRLPKTLEHVAIGINSNKEVFLYSKTEQTCLKLQIPNTSSFLINESNSTPENIFIYNINRYNLSNFTIPQILEDIFSKTPYVDKPIGGYIASIDDLASKSFDKIIPFIKESSPIITYQLSQLETI